MQQIWKIGIFFANFPICKGGFKCAPVCIYHIFINVKVYGWQCHGTYIRWKLRNGCARKKQSLLFDLFKAMICSRAVTNRFFFLRKDLFILRECATCSELPSNISTMGCTVVLYKIKQNIKKTLNEYTF